MSGTKGIARWDGQSWSPLGSGLGSTVFDLLVFDDGTGGGSALYAGGSFIADVGGASALGVARWDGQSWSALGSGISGWVWNLAVFDDGSGSGPALFAGGTSRWPAARARTTSPSGTDRAGAHSGAV